MMSTSYDITTEITEDDLRRVRRAISNLPYGGMVHLSPSHINDVDGIVAWLDAFAGALTRVAERVTENREELRELRQQRQALRMLIGVDKDDA